MQSRVYQRFLTFLLLLLTLSGTLWPRPGQAMTVTAQSTPPLIQLRTLTNINIAVVNLSWSFVGAQADWVVYATLFQAKPWLPQYTTNLVLRNILSGREISIHSASWNDANGTFHPAALTNISFRMPYLLWHQDATPLPPDAQNITPSTFDCTICYYDFSRGTGGRATALENLAPIPGGSPPVPLGIDTNGRALLIGPDKASLWLANLQGSEKKQIYTGTSAIQTAFGQTYGYVTAWTQHTQDNADGFFLYNDQTGQVQALPRPARLPALVLAPGQVFWADGANIARYDVPSGQTQAVASGLGSISAFDVSGDNLAWITHPQDGNPSILTVRNWRTGQAVAQAPITPDGSGTLGIALDGAQVVVSVYWQYGVPGMEQAIKIGWLPDSADPAFAQVWERADGAVAQKTVTRPWLWGPGALYLGWEPYANSRHKQRQVLYYDKSRMEINQPSYDPAVRAQPYYVSNGLLVDEMISGEIRVGDTAVITASVPCTIPVAGDPRKDNPLTPDYATLAAVASLHGEHQAPDRRGQPVNDAIDLQGALSTDSAHGTLVRYAAFVPQTGHNVPDIFWAYRTSMQITYGFDWTFVLGYPLTEGYWTRMRVGGKDYPVLIQAFQRRVLTFAPDFPGEWRLQQGNVGQHYFEWRYTLNAPGSPAPTR